MKVSVIIVNYNHKYFPRLAVEALEKSLACFPYEIIVVDNNSSDDESLTFLNQAHREKRIIFVKSSRNLGFGRGNNIGAGKARGKYLFFHNPDAIVQTDTLKKMAEYLEKHSDIGILGPKLVYSSEKVQESCRRNMTLTDLVLRRTFLGKLPFFQNKVQRYLMHDFDHNKVQDVDLITGAAMMIPRHVYDAVNGFDERYFLFMEDFDLCRMVKRAGFRIVYYPPAKMTHYHKRLSEGSMLNLVSKRVFWLHIISAIKYFWKWRK